MKNLTPLLALPLILFATIPSSAGAPPVLPIPPMPSVSGPEVPNGNVLAQSISTARPDKDGRILVPAFTVAESRWTREWNEPSSLILDAPAAPYPLTDTTMAAYMDADVFTGKSRLRDKAKVVLTPAVVAHLRDLGIEDSVTPFKGYILQVRGQIHEMFVGNNGNNGIYIIYKIVVDRIEDIKVAKGDRPGSAVSTVNTINTDGSGNQAKD